MARRCILGVGAWACVGLAVAIARADTVQYCDDVSFASDTEPAELITLPKFDVDGAGGPYILNSVLVEVRSSGSANVQIDNDDGTASPTVRGRIIRQFSLTGPGGVSVNGNQTTVTSNVGLGPDNGDGAGMFDSSAPDGTTFGGPVSYSNILAGSATPPTAAYQSSGPDTVDFTATPTLISNDQQWIGPPPAQFQLEAQASDLTVEVCVTYDFSNAGGPAAIPTVSEWGLIIMTLLLLTGATMVFGRRRGSVAA